MGITCVVGKYFPIYVSIYHKRPICHTRKDDQFCTWSAAVCPLLHTKHLQSQLTLEEELSACPQSVYPGLYYQSQL